MQNATLDQSGYRFRNDDGGETGATWIAGTNTGVTFNVTREGAFRLRLAITETAGAATTGSGTSFQIQYSLNGGTWTTPTTSTPIQVMASSNVADGDATTQQISSGTFLTGRIDSSTDEAVSGDNTQIDFAGGETTEVEYALFFDSSQLSSGDTVDFRAYDNGNGNVLSTYSQTPTLSVSANIPESGTTPVMATPLASESTTPLIISWKAGSDWDDFNTQSGVVHESTQYSDYNDAGLLQQGYPLQAPLFQNACIGFFPLHEDSGTTAYDYSQIGATGTYVGGPTLGQPGLLGTTCPSFDDVDDYIEFSDRDVWSLFTSGTSAAASAWVNIDSSINPDNISGKCVCKELEWGIHPQNQTAGSGMYAPRFDTWGANNTGAISDVMTPGQWHFMHFNWTAGSYVDAYVDGSLHASASISDTSVNDTSPLSIGAHVASDGTSGDYLPGRTQYNMVWNRELTTSEIQTLYDVVATSGTLTTNKRVL